MEFAFFFIILPSLLSSASALTLYYYPRILKYTFFTLIGISGSGAIWIGSSLLINQQNSIYQIGSNFPNLTFQFMIDPLSGFFIAIVGIITLSVAFYGPGYVKNYERQNSSIRGLSFFTGLFISSMYLVMLANDIFTFMCAWELMSISSYFLVAYHHEHEANRHAALVYLLMAQASGLIILIAFSILATSSTDITFAALQSVKISPMQTTIIFLISFIGFGMKAGIVPLHVWLPRAHPVAPSHISALMSGVMLKVAVYGFIRFGFYILKNVSWQCGSIVLLAGVISALFGVLYALMQHDLKKLLAYHSVENIGIIFIGLGLSLIFLNNNYHLLAALGLIAALYHCLNHAIFKSLLFLGAGAVLQQTNEHDLELMGGLIKKMPYTAWFFLVGCISISAIPPFNGFISEWLTLLTAFQAMTLKSVVMRTLIPVAAMLLVLTSALAATCFVKVYGITFLGQPRTKHILHAHDPQFGMRFALGFLAILCLLLGIFPTFTISLLNSISFQLINIKLSQTNNLLWLIPINSNISSYNPLLITIGILIIGIVCFFFIHLYFGHNKIRTVKPWDCGYGRINAKMQYSASAFAMPLRHVFHAIWIVREKIEKIGSNINYNLQIGDWIWEYIYAPIEHLSFTLKSNFAKLQNGNIRVYLSYMLITLILLLWVIT